MIFFHYHVEYIFTYMEMTVSRVYNKKVYLWPFVSGAYS